jgi:hypothetical protein
MRADRSIGLWLPSDVTRGTVRLVAIGTARRPNASGPRRRLADAVLSRKGSSNSREWPTAAPSPASLFEAERAFGSWGSDSSPGYGVALSGGGNRSTAFSMGVLHALHESGRLEAVDVISAVSGGSYTLSWYLLQQFYANNASGRDAASGRIDDELFDPEGRFQRYEEANATLGGSKFDLVFNTALSAVLTPSRSTSSES